MQRFWFILLAMNKSSFISVDVTGRYLPVKINTSTVIAVDIEVQSSSLMSRLYTYYILVSFLILCFTPNVTRYISFMWSLG